MRGFLQISENDAAKTQSFTWPGCISNPTRGFIQQKQNARFATTAIQNYNFKMYVSLQRRAQNCMNPAIPHRIQKSPLPQFQTSDQHDVTRGLRPRRANFAFHQARSDERVARAMCKIRISHSFGRPTSAK